MTAGNSPVFSLLEVGVPTLEDKIVRIVSIADKLHRHKLLMFLDFELYGEFCVCSSTKVPDVDEYNIDWYEYEEEFYNARLHEFQIGAAVIHEVIYVTEDAEEAGRMDAEVFDILNRVSKPYLRVHRMR